MTSPSSVGHFLKPGSRGATWKQRVSSSPFSSFSQPQKNSLLFLCTPAAHTQLFRHQSCGFFFSHHQLSDTSWVSSKIQFSSDANWSAHRPETAPPPPPRPVPLASPGCPLCFCLTCCAWVPITPSSGWIICRNDS